MEINKKTITIIAGAILIIVLISVGVYAAKNKQSNTPEIPNTESQQEEEIVETPLEEEEEWIEAEYPEIEWEEPPVTTAYNPEADLDNSGYVDKNEWEQWVAAHPEDIDQNLYVEDWEIEIINNAKKNDPTVEISKITEEEREQIVEEREKEVEQQVQQAADAILDDFDKQMKEWASQQTTGGSLEDMKNSWNPVNN